MIKLFDILNEIRPYKGGESKYTEDSILAAAKKYKSPYEFQQKDPGAYNAARSRGMLPDLKKVFTSGNKYYSDEEIKNIAKKYEYIEDFKADNLNVYNTAVKRGIWNDIKRGLKNREERVEKDRLVYVYTFPEELNEKGESVKYAYVGLTAREHKRKGEHGSETRKYLSPIIKHEKESGNKAAYKILSATSDNPSGYVSEDEARRQEEYYIQDYRTKGWLLLNKRPAGSLGGGSKKLYSDEDLANIALKYDNKEAFNKFAHNAAVLASGRGILKTITSHMTSKRTEYDNDVICNACKKAKQEGKSLKAYSENIYAAARRAAKKQGVSTGDFIENCLKDSTITESIDDKEILRRVINGFELVPAKYGFGHPYVTKNGKATHDLAIRINTWIQKEFPYSNIETKFEKIHRTLNFFRK